MRTVAKDHSSTGIVKLARNAFVQWCCDREAPVSWVMDRPRTAARFGVDVAVRADTAGHSWTDRPAVVTPTECIGINRAGPRGACLTPEAIRRRFECQNSFEGFVLHPGDIAVYRTSFVVAPDDELYGIEFYVPWRPGEEPDVIDDCTDLHALVPESRPRHPKTPRQLLRMVARDVRVNRPG
jgi:hypothetical protein